MFKNTIKILLITTLILLILPSNVFANEWVVDMNQCDGILYDGKYDLLTNTIEFNGKLLTTSIHKASQTTSTFTFTMYEKTAGTDESWVLSDITGIPTSYSSDYRTLSSCFIIYNDELYLIFYGNYGFYEMKTIGYKWNGTEWESNSEIINGLPNHVYTSGDFDTQPFESLRYGRIDAINYQDYNYIIISGYDGNMVGYKFSDGVWTDDTNITNGLPTMRGKHSIFTNEGKLYFIMSDYSGYNYYCYEYTDSGWIDTDDYETGLVVRSGWFINEYEVSVEEESLANPNVFANGNELVMLMTYTEVGTLVDGFEIDSYVATTPFATSEGVEEPVVEEEKNNAYGVITIKSTEDLETNEEIIVEDLEIENVEEEIITEDNEVKITNVIFGNSTDENKYLFLILIVLISIISYGIYRYKKK